MFFAYHDNATDAILAVEANTRAAANRLIQIECRTPIETLDVLPFEGRPGGTIADDDILLAAVLALDSGNRMLPRLLRRIARAMGLQS